MVTHYKKSWLSAFKTLTVFTLAMLFSGYSFGQLSGTKYVIDKNGTASSTVYKSFKDFVSDLQSGTRSDGGTPAGPGVDAAVAVTVAAKSGPYTEQIRIPAIKGASAKNTITFDGNGQTLQFTATSSSNSYTIRLDGADYITVKDLTIIGSGTSYGRCVHLRSSADNNVIEGCNLQLPNIGSTSNYNAYVMIANGNASPTSSRGDAGEGNVIKNCKTSAASGKGPRDGMAQYNATNNGKFVNTFDGNDVKDWRANGLYLYHTRSQIIKNNNIHNTGNSFSGNKYGVYTYNYRGYGHGHTITGNKIHDMNGTARNTSAHYGVYLYGYYAYKSADDIIVNDNEITIENNGTNYGIYNYGYQSQVDADLQMNGNTIKVTHNNPSRYYQQYGINNYIYYSRNLDALNIDDNKIQMISNRYAYGIRNYAGYLTGLVKNGSVANNQIDLHTGYYTYGIYHYTYGASKGIDVTHNTIHNTEAPGVTPTGRAYLIYNYYNQGDLKNNIVTSDWQSGDIFPVYYYHNGSASTWDYNDFYTGKAAGNVTYYDVRQNRSSFEDWQKGSGGANSMKLDPNFKDVAKEDFTPSSFSMVNRGTPTAVKKDINGTTRNATNPDLGAIEFFIDIAITADKMTGSSECGGYMEPVVMTVKNNTTDTLSNIPLGYDLDGEFKASEILAGPLDPGASVDYTFNKIPEFNGNKTHTVYMYLNASDDATSNDSLTHKITTTESPYGAALVEKGTFAGYFALGGNGGSMAKPDVTVPGVEVEYEIQPPANHPNTTFSTGWTLTPVHMTASGTPVSSGITYSAPSGSTSGNIKYDPDVSLGDSLVFIGFKAKSIASGCDSTFGRWIYVPHSPNVDFDVSDVCDGEVISFASKSTLKKGVMTYDWDFNDPKSVEDFSEISDPVYKYVTYGVYTVDLDVHLFDYPKFTWTKSKTVTVFPVPAVDFKVTNACEGIDLTFKNNTTSPIGGTINYTWNFGDGSANSNVTDPTHKYAKAGGYQVRLTASLNGCASVVTKNANQFARPVASFSVDGKCNLEDVKFKNGTTIAIGRSGYRWDFGDKNISRLDNPTHAFANAGSHTVKMTAVSEFGCEDDAEQTFNLNESPAADFSFTDPCNLTEIEFKREGTLPAGNSIFEWDFSGEAMSTQENPKQQFPKIGVKNVSLKISSDNGCTDMITKEFVVKLQAQAAFVASSVCEGEEVVFTNKSEVAAGGLNYLWRFGDGTTSKLTSPRHGFKLSKAGETESFRVTLVAEVEGGCADSVAETVTVNAKSDASFDAKAEGRNLMISNQATTTPDFIYNWRFGDGGKSSAVTPSYSYVSDADKFNVCLAIINSANCLSENCENVTVDVLGLTDLNMRNDMVNVYPNPNKGLFSVDVKDPQSDLTIAIVNVLGDVVKVVSPNNLSGTYNFDLSSVSAGVYMIQVSNGGFAAVHKITIQ